MEETHSNRQRYEWQIKGWSRCNKNLEPHLGFQVQQRVWWRNQTLGDKVLSPGHWTGETKTLGRKSPPSKRIRNRLCGPKRSRPGRREKKRCNTFRSGFQNLALYPQFLHSCDMEWVAGDWEPCTTSCGKNGTRQREVKSTTISRAYLMFYEGLLSSPGRPKDRPALVEHARHPPLRPSYQTSR